MHYAVDETQRKDKKRSSHICQHFDGHLEAAGFDLSSFKPRASSNRSNASVTPRNLPLYTSGWARFG
jgi:hypothetical protein